MLRSRMGRDPTADLGDVLIRIANHPDSDIDALLPNLWKPRPSTATTA